MNKIYLSALALLATATISAQVLNPSFENWTAGEPDSWDAMNVITTFGDVTDGAAAVDPATEITTGGTQGSSHLRLTSFTLANSTSTTTTDGDYGSYAAQDFLSADKFVDFSFDVRYDIKTNDTALIAVQAYNAAGNLVGAGLASYAGNQATFTTSTIAMTYTGVPVDYTIFIASSEAQILNSPLSTIKPGSWLEVDNIVVGAVVPDAPNVSNVVAADISDNKNGSDLQLTFNVPTSETNVDKYYVIAIQSNITPAQLNFSAFVTGSGIEITPNGAAQSYNFTAAGEYYKINAAGNAVEATPIVENVEMVLYVLVKGKTGYNNVFMGSNPITLTSPVSVTDQYKEISIYPNPANNFVNFKIEGLENGTVIINSVTGQEVVNTTINNNKQVDVSNLNNGVYIYTVRNQNGEIVKTNKLVISK